MSVEILYHLTTTTANMLGYEAFIKKPTAGGNIAKVKKSFSKNDTEDLHRWCFLQDTDLVYTRVNAWMDSTSYGLRNHYYRDTDLCKKMWPILKAMKAEAEKLTGANKNTPADCAAVVDAIQVELLKGAPVKKEGKVFTSWFRLDFLLTEYREKYTPQKEPVYNETF